MLAFFEPLVKSFQQQTDLERWIVSHHPKDPSDVERLIKEYNYSTTRVWI